MKRYCEGGASACGPKTLGDSMKDDLLWRNLAGLPAFRALLRAVEARFYQDLPLPEPSLDLGCGDAHFASVTFRHQLAAGVDPWALPLREARRLRDVVREADRFRMVKADVTEETATTTALTQAYGVKGVPTVILFSPSGGEHQRMVGYVGPDEMLAAMRNVH